MAVSEVIGFITSYDLRNVLKKKKIFHLDILMNHGIPNELDLNLQSSSLSTPRVKRAQT